MCARGERRRERRLWRDQHLDAVSRIDVKTRTKNPTDIPVGVTQNGGPIGVAIAPCRQRPVA